MFFNLITIWCGRLHFVRVRVRERWTDLRINMLRRANELLQVHMARDWVPAFVWRIQLHPTLHCTIFLCRIYVEQHALGLQWSVTMVCVLNMQMSTTCFGLLSLAIKGKWEGGYSPYVPRWIWISFKSAWMEQITPNWDCCLFLYLAHSWCILSYLHIK